MSPNLALALCSAFVLFLLWLERKQSSNVTRALWIPTIWMLYAASKPLGVWFQSSVEDPDLGSPLDRAFLIVLICVTLWILVRRRFDWSSAMKENRWLILLIVFMLVSILWSSMPYISFKRWARELLAVLMAFAVLSEPSPRQAIESILRRMTYILIPFSILLIKYFRDYGIDYTRDWNTMWIGVTLHKNSLGQLCVIAIFFLFWSISRKWKKRIMLVWRYEKYAELFVLAIALWLLRGPGGTQYSATAISALGAGLLIYAGLRISKKYGYNLGIKILSILVVVIIIVGIVAVFTSGSSVGFIASAAGRDKTLTGRTEIWAKLLPFAVQKPLLGGGYGSFWTTSRRNAIAQHAHSGYLEVLLGLGFVGILLLSIFILSSCKKAQLELSHDFDWGTLWVGFLIMLLVHSITESSIQNFTAPLTAIVLLFTTSSREASAKN